MYEKHSTNQRFSEKHSTNISGNSPPLILAMNPPLPESNLAKPTISHISTSPTTLSLEFLRRHRHHILPSTLLSTCRSTPSGSSEKKSKPVTRSTSSIVNASLGCCELSFL